jgi:hypothetical protein
MRRIPGLVVLVLAVSSGAYAQVAFRFTDLDLRDPHVFADLPLFGCTDITDDVPLGLIPSFNEYLQESITMDTDQDQLLDLSPLIVFLSGDGVATGSRSGPNRGDPSGDLVVHDGLCSDPMETTICDPDPNKPMYRASYSDLAVGTCLEPIPGTTGSYSPPVVVPSGPCFATDPLTLVLEVQGVELELQSTYIAATYVGDPPTSLVDGLLMGFLSEGAADTLLLPEELAIVGGQPVSSILPGGTGVCASHDDRDLGPDGSTLGWWFYMNFEAVQVPILAATWSPPPSHEIVSATSLELAPAFPNPFQRKTTLHYTLSRSASIKLFVVDVRGTHVQTIFEGFQPAGRHEAAWNGRGSRGAPVASGVYFVHLASAEGTNRTQRVVLTR